MKNQYFGDVGDFGKYGLLLSILNTNLKLGVNWYLTNDDETNDGSHINYLKSQSTYDYEKCDKELFSYLNDCIKNGERNVRNIENYSRFKNTYFYSDIIDISSINALNPQGRDERRAVRKKCFETSLKRLSDCEIIFLDPDNGLETSSVSKASKDSVKYVFYDEVRELYRLGKSVITYNHRDRSKEVDYKKRIVKIYDELGYDIKLLILRFGRYSVRDYIFVLQDKHYNIVEKQINEFLKGNWSSLFKYYECKL